MLLDVDCCFFCVFAVLFVIVNCLLCVDCCVLFVVCWLTCCDCCRCSVFIVRCWLLVDGVLLLFHVRSLLFVECVFVVWCSICAVC